MRMASSFLVHVSWISWETRWILASTIFEAFSLVLQFFKAHFSIALITLSGSGTFLGIREYLLLGQEA